MQFKEVKNEILGEEMAMHAIDSSIGFDKSFEAESEKVWEIVLLLALVAGLYAMQVDFKLLALLTLSYLVIFFGFGKSLIAKLPLRQIFTKSFNRKVVASFLFIGFSILMATGINLELIFLTTVFFAFVFYKWNGRFSTVLGLAFLMSSPVLWLYGLEVSAAKVATYAYYFLAISVIFEIIEYFKELKESQEILVLMPNTELSENYQETEESSIKSEKIKKSYFGLGALLMKAIRRIGVDLGEKKTHSLVLATVFATLLFHSNLIIASGAVFFLAFLWFYWEIDVLRFLAIASFILYMLVNAFNASFGEVFVYATAYFLIVWIALEIDRGFFARQTE